MSTYSDQVLTEKLEKLSNSQQSIQTLCHWVMYHRKRFKQSVKIWEREMRKAAKERKITFLYLANDIIQNSRKRGGEFIQEFKRILKESLSHIYTETVPKTKPNIIRIINIWDERRVFPPEFITELRTELQELGGPSAITQTNTQSDNNIEQTKITTSLSSVVAEIEQIAPLCDLHRDRVSQLDFQMLSPEFLTDFKTKEDISEPAQKVETACNTIETYIAHLEEDLRRRVRLLTLVNQSIQDTDTKLEMCKKQQSDFDDLKDRMKTLFEGLPSASDNLVPPSSSLAGSSSTLQYLNMGPLEGSEGSLPVDDNEYSPSPVYKKLKTNPPFEMIGQNPMNFEPVAQTNYPLSFFPGPGSNAPNLGSLVTTTHHQGNQPHEPPSYNELSSSLYDSSYPPQTGARYAAAPNYTFL